LPSSSNPKDFLWLQLRDLPYFRGVLRAVESRFYQKIDLPQPVLDLGCGDGHFVTITFDQPIDFGIDPWSGPVKQAARRGGYRIVVQGSGDRIPVPSKTFASVMSNSVLEHIPDLDPVLAEVARVIQPGGLFVFCVPNHNFLDNLSVSTFFDRIGLHFLGNAYRSFFNRISRHYHCDTPEVWEDRLTRAGFRIERWWHYFSPESLHVLEWGHYLGLPSLVMHFLFRRWILIKQPWNLALAKAICQSAFDEPDSQPKGSYTFYITRRMGGQ
jgi:SAM-dependent methyltransferase